MLFNNVFNNKKIIVTGHTGFKGSWLSTWLIELGAEVYGISKDIPTSPSLFDELKLKDRLKHHIIDIRDAEKLSSTIHRVQPDFVFHLAAQPILELVDHRLPTQVSSRGAGRRSSRDLQFRRPQLGLHRMPHWARVQRSTRVHQEQLVRPLGRGQHEQVVLDDALTPQLNLAVDGRDHTAGCCSPP